MDKNSKLKKLLAATSALAVIVGAGNAMGAQYKTNNGNGGAAVVIADAQAVVNAVDHGTNAGGNWNANDSIYALHAVALQLGNGGNTASVGTIDVNNVLAGITVVENSSVGSIISSGGGARANLVVNNNKTLTFNGTAGLNAAQGAQVGGVYSGIGTIVLGSGANPGTIIIDTNATFDAATTIDSNAAADDGVINILANRTVTFNGAIGGTDEVSSITAANAAIINLNDNASFGAVGPGGFTLTGATTRLNVANGVTITGKIIAGGGAGNGVLAFNGIGNSTVTDTIGAGGAIKEIIANSNGVVTLGGGGAAVLAQTLTVANAGADVRISANGLTGATVFNANGLVKVAANGVVTGAVTSTVGGATGANGGRLEFALAGTGEVTGLIGTAANRLDTVQLTGAGALHLSAAGNANHYARQFLFKDNAAILKVAAGGVIHGDAVANANGNGVVRFLGAGEYDGRIGDGPAGFGLAMFEANGAGIVKVGAGEHKAAVFTLTDNASEFEFANGANLTTNINVAAAANAQKVKFVGSGSVSGTTGTANALSELNLTGDVNSVVKFGGTTKATNINIGAGTLEMNNAGDLVGITNFTDVARGGNLLISGAGAHLVNGAVVTGVGAGGGKGTITIANSVGANAVAFKGQIGDHAVVDNALKLLSIDSADSVNFTGANNSQITAISFGANTANTGTLNFAQANSTYKIGGITAVNNKGILKITENTTFESAANNAAVTFGTNDAKLHKVVFENGKTLVVGDGISIYATTVHATNNANGILSFAGNSTFSAAGVNGNALLTINVLGGAGKVVKLLDVTEITGNATVAANGTLEIANNFTSALLQGAGASNGTVRFTNGAAMTVAGAVGQGGNSLKAIEFAGGDVDFTGQVAHAAGNEFTFSGNAATTVTLTNALTNVGGNNFVNNSENGIKHTVILKNALTNFNVVKLAENGKQINFQLDNGVNAKISGASVALGANFTTGTHTKGELELNAANVVINSAGAFGKNLAKVQFTLDGGITNGLFAEQVIVAAAKTATIGGRIVSGDFSLAGDNSKVILSNGAIVDAAIKATLANKGLVEFAGGATLNQDIGTGANKAASVTFADDAQFIASLNTANIFADTIALRKGVVSLSQNITLNGATTIASTPLALSDKKLTVAAGNTLAFSGNNNITFNVTANGDTATGGQIASLGVLEFDPAATIVVRPNDAKNSRPTAGKTRSFTLISSAVAVANGRTLDLTKVTMDDSVNPFTKWTPTIDGTGGLALTQEDNAKQVIMDLLGTSLDATDKINIEALTSAAQGTDAAKIVDLLSSLTDSSGKLVKAKVDETLDRLPPVSTVSDAIETASGAVSMGLSQRMTNLAGSQGTTVQSRTVASSDAAMSGIAAGDEGARYGAWISPFFGKTTQKERKGAAGYKSSSYGASFGFDTRANDDMIIGGAVTVANNEMKHRNFKSGDKTKISSMMFSIYGMQQITDSWFAHGVATFGSNDVKNSERRVSGLTTYDTVSGKYTSMSFNGEAMFGYNFLTEQVTFTPMAGLRYSRVNDGGYKETGSTTGQNLDVNTKASNKLEVVAGARVAGGTFGMNGMTVTPEIHGFINHDIIGKNPKQTLGLAGTNGLAVKSNKPVKTTFNVGVGVNFAYNMMEYGAGYDAEIANKRLGHQGTLKLRVNF